MDRHLLIAGQGRAGSTMFYSMLQHTLVGFSMPGTEIRASEFVNIPGSFCTKRPYDIFDYAALVETFRNAKPLDLIVTLRDPRDILTSFHQAVPDDYFYSADYAYYIHADGGPTRTLPGLIMTHLAILDALHSDLCPRGAFLLKYEHLVADPDRIQQLLADGLGLEFNGKFSDFHQRRQPENFEKAMNGVRPVATDRIAKWRRQEHHDRIIDQFTRFPMLHDIVVELGYEPDTSWYHTYLEEAEAAKTVAQRQRRVGL